MATETSDLPEPVFWTLLGGLLTSVIAGISWVCQKKCRNQTCDINSGCCKFHSSSRLKETIREEIAKDRKERDAESHTDIKDELNSVI
jgi:hypothetical protein